MNELGNRAQRVAAMLKAKGHTIGVSESSGGGLVSACLLAVPALRRISSAARDVHAYIP